MNVDRTRDGSRLRNQGRLHPDSKYSLGVRTVVGCHPTHAQSVGKRPYRQTDGDGSHLISGLQNRTPRFRQLELATLEPACRK